MSSILKGILNEGISAQDLADVLYNRLTMRYPDIVNRYGHEVVGDIISDVASFHEGAEELGTSDIGGMIRQIINKLENYNIDEAVDPAQQTVYAQVKGLVDQLDKRGKQNVSKALKKNLGVVTEEDEVDYDDKYQSMVKRVGQMAKEGPRKTAWDPVKKVYKTVPVGQPKTDASFQAYLAKRRAAKQGLGEGWKEETAEHDEFLQHARQQLQNASVMERIRLAQRLSKLEQKHFPEMFSSESNGISSSIFGMLQNVIDSSPRPNQQFGNVVTPQGTGSSEPLRPEPISARPSGATTSFAEPDDELEQEQDFFTWYQSASAEQQAELQQDIASEENMSPEEAKEYIEYMVQNGKIEPEEWKQKYANTVDEGFDPIRPLDLKHWAQKVKMYYPDAQIISAKMPGGPSIAKSGGVQVGSFDPSKGTSKIIRPQGVSSISAGSTMEEGVAEEWSQKYKSSINCSHPKGFSQKAHCAGKKKHNESIEMEMTCPDCSMCETHGDHKNLDEACWKGYHKEGNKKMFGKTYPNCVKNEDVQEEKCPHCNGPMFSEMIMNEKKDACYYKVKSRYKVWPSAYASGALVKCRKKGADSWGNGGKKNESVEDLDENLHKWFQEKWVRFGPDGKIRGACARGDDSEGKPKCLPQSKAQNLGKKGRASAAARKRREDPNPERSGKAINVNTKKKSNESVAENKKFTKSNILKGLMG